MKKESKEAEELVIQEAWRSASGGVSIMNKVKMHKMIFLAIKVNWKLSLKDPGRRDCAMLPLLLT